MRWTKENYMVLIILPIILLMCFGVWSIKTDDSFVARIRSDVPEWDLTNVDLKNQIARVEGMSVEYVPNALLTPDSFDAHDDIRIGCPAEDVQFYTARYPFLCPTGNITPLHLQALTTPTAFF